MKQQHIDGLKHTLKLVLRQLEAYRKLLRAIKGGNNRYIDNVYKRRIDPMLDSVNDVYLAVKITFHSLGGK